MNNRHPHPDVVRQGYSLSAPDRSRLLGQRGVVIWLTGLPGSGKSTLADAVEGQLHGRGLLTMVLDGDNMRTGLNADLGFSPTDRRENVRRVGHVAKVLTEAGVIPIVALVSPFEADRQSARSLFPADQFIEVHVDTPATLCAERDPKGLFRRAEQGQITNLTGVGQAYERPVDPELRLSGDGDLAANASKIVQAVLDRQGEYTHTRDRGPE